jgi:hypothetical protein
LSRRSVVPADGTSKGKNRQTKRPAEDAGGVSGSVKRRKTVPDQPDPSTASAMERRHEMTAAQVEKMLRELETEKDKQKGVKKRSAHQIAMDHPGATDPNRRWLSSAGWKQKKLDQTLSRFDDYEQHRASIQRLVAKLKIYEGSLPEPQEPYHLRFTAENLLAVLEALHRHRNMDTNRSAFTYVENQTGLHADSLKRFVRADGSLAMPRERLVRLPDYEANRERLEAAMRALDHAETADKLPEGGVLRPKKMAADVLADALEALANDPKTSIADIGIALGFDRETLQRYVGPRAEGIRGRRNPAELPNYGVAQRDAIAAALTKMGHHDQAERLPKPVGGVSSTRTPGRINRGASLVNRASAKGRAGMPIARTVDVSERSAPKRDVPRLGDSDRSAPAPNRMPTAAAKGKARAESSEGSEVETEWDTDGSSDTDADSSEGDADSSALATGPTVPDGSRHRTSASQVEALLRSLEADNRRPPESRSTVRDIVRAGVFPGPELTNTRWLSASTWRTLRLHVVLSRTEDYEQHRAAIQRLVNRLGLFTGTLPDAEQRYHRHLTADELLAALNARAGFDAEPHEQRRGGAHAYMRRAAGLGDSSVLERWITAEGKLKYSLGQLNSLPGYATNRRKLRNAFGRLGHVDTADNMPEASGRNVEGVTAEVVADALKGLAKNPRMSLDQLGRELGPRGGALGRYIGRRPDGRPEVRDLIRLAALPDYDDTRRKSIATALEAGGNHEQAAGLPLPPFMRAGDFLDGIRTHDRHVADAIKRMREDPGLSSREAAKAAGAPEKSFVLAVGRGPKIRDQATVESRLSRLDPQLRQGLGETMERLGALTRGEPVEAVGMTEVTLGAGSYSGRRRFIVENAEFGGNERDGKLKRLYQANPAFVRRPRSYAQDRPRQALRWLSTVLNEYFDESREVQAYYDRETRRIHVASNVTQVNHHIRALLADQERGLDSLLRRRETEQQISRATRHWNKLKSALSSTDRHADALSDEILNAMRQNHFDVPVRDYQRRGGSVDVHAERRIDDALESRRMDLDLLAGVRRACGHCAAALDFGAERPRGPFWESMGARHGLRNRSERIITENMAKSVGSYVTQTRDGRMTINHNTDSEGSTDEVAAPPRSRQPAPGSSVRGSKRATGEVVKRETLGQSRKSGSGLHHQEGELDPTRLEQMSMPREVTRVQEPRRESGGPPVIGQMPRGTRLSEELPDRFARAAVSVPHDGPDSDSSMSISDDSDDDVPLRNRVKAESFDGEENDLSDDMDVSDGEPARLSDARLPVPPNGWCLLYSVMAGVPRGVQLDGVAGHVDPETHRAAVAQLVNANSGRDLGSAADPDGPLGRSAAALHRAVLRWVRGSGPEDLPADVVARFRRSQEQMNALSDDLEALSDPELRERLTEAGVTSVRDASWIQASGAGPARGLRRQYARLRLQELNADSSQRDWSFESRQAQVQSELELVQDRTGNWVAAPNARGIPGQFEYLAGRGVNMPIDLLDVDGLRAAVRETNVDRPLSAGEYRQLIARLQAWEPGTVHWSSAYGEMFPGLVAHALGVQLEIRRPGSVERIGPTTGRTVVVAYNGVDHYDAIIDTTPRRRST